MNMIKGITSNNSPGSAMSGRNKKCQQKNHSAGDQGWKYKGVSP